VLVGRRPASVAAPYVILDGLSGLPAVPSCHSNNAALASSSSSSAAAAAAAAGWHQSLLASSFGFEVLALANDVDVGVASRGRPAFIAACPSVDDRRACGAVRRGVRRGAAWINGVRSACAFMKSTPIRHERGLVRKMGAHVDVSSFKFQQLTANRYRPFMPPPRPMVGDIKQCCDVSVRLSVCLSCFFILSRSLDASKRASPPLQTQSIGDSTVGYFRVQVLSAMGLIASPRDTLLLTTVVVQVKRSVCYNVCPCVGNWSK